MRGNRITVAVHGDEPERLDGESNVAIASVYEFGSLRVPVKPFIRPTWDANVEKYARQLLGAASRARAIKGHQQAGCIFLPRSARWLETFIEEAANFPMGKNDDLVDMTTQAILHRQRRESRAWWLE